MARAFADYEANRPKRVELPPLRFLGGPYRAPEVKVGQWIECERFGQRRVLGWSEGPIPWPLCRRTGPMSLVLCGDLVRAVEGEAAIVVALAWGVSRQTVHIWRRLLGVVETNAGTHSRWQSNIAEVISPPQANRGLAKAHAPDARLRAEATKRERGHVSNRRVWTPEEIALLGTCLDTDLARALDIDTRSVANERRRLGIVAARHRRERGAQANRATLEGAKLKMRRLEKGWSQTQLGALVGCQAARISHLENIPRTRVENQTLEKLALALGCASATLQVLEK